MQEFEYNNENLTDAENGSKELENEKFSDTETLGEQKSEEKGLEKSTENPQVKYIPVPVYMPPLGPTPEEIEKRTLKKTAMLAGLACLVMTAVTVLWSTVYFAVMSVFGFSTQHAYEIANDPFVLQFLQIVISTLMFVFPFTIIYKLGGFKISDTIMLSKPEKGTVLPLTLIGIGFCSFANIAVSMAGSFFEGFGIDYSVDRAEDPNGILGFIISFIATAIVPALVEEYACRGLILGSLKKFGEGFSIIVSAVVFGLIHGNFEQIPFAFLIGLALGFITIKSGSIWVACLIHFINNALSVILDYLFRNFSDDVLNLAYNVYLMVALILAIVGAALFAKRKEDAFSFKKAETLADEVTKHKWFFTQPLIIILIIICTIESVTHFF